MWSIHTMEYDSALQRKDILTMASTWINPGDIALSEMDQEQKERYCLSPPLRS